MHTLSHKVYFELRHIQLYTYALKCSLHEQLNRFCNNYSRKVCFTGLVSGCSMCPFSIDWLSISFQPHQHPETEDSPQARYPPSTLSPSPPPSTTTPSPPSSTSHGNAFQNVHMATTGEKALRGLFNTPIVYVCSAILTAFCGHCCHH